MNKAKRYSPEVRERAVQLLFEHGKDYRSRWAAAVSIASKIGCAAETLRGWARRVEIGTGRRDGMASEDRARMRVLEKENKESRRANGIPGTASAFFARAELDRQVRPSSELIHHSDRGAQCLPIRYTERLGEAGVIPSAGRVGNSYDNALAETVIGLFKTEAVRRQGPWKSLDEVEYATLAWVDWFNNKRLLEPIGNRPPTEKEDEYYRQLEGSAMAAWLKQNGLR